MVFSLARISPPKNLFFIGFLQFPANENARLCFGTAFLPVCGREKCAVIIISERKTRELFKIHFSPPQAGKNEKVLTYIILYREVFCKQFFCEKLFKNFSIDKERKFWYNLYK